MIKYMYKYMPLREEFFENLMLRATPFGGLNDPFEGIFNKRQLKDADYSLNKCFSSQDNSECTLEGYELDGLMGAFQSDFDSVGVLSFTEDFTNPLMWAHYADEHKGIVLEFDYDKPLFQDSIKILEERKSRFGGSALGDIYEFPERVMYRRELPSFRRPEEVRPSLQGGYPWTNFLYSLFFTKSNDWIYEKELRSIVQLSDSDRIVCKKDSHVLKVLLDNTDIEWKELDSGKIQITYPREYEMHEDMGDESIKNEIYMHTSFENIDNIHLFRINPEAISGIYCGCKCDYKRVQELITTNRQISHLQDNIYVMEINNYQYQLDCRKI